MENNFIEPVCEIVRFEQTDIVTISGCGCNVGGEDFGEGQNETCTSANVSCSCDPNYDDPSANCA